MASDPAAQTRLRDHLKALFSSIGLVLSPNRSSRRGASVQGVVIHTTESAVGSLQGVVNYFRSAGTEVSSHYIVADVAPKGAEFTTVVQMVPESEKAWTARSANPVTINYELVGRASRSREDWLGPYRLQLETTAALVAEDVLQYGIPVRREWPGIVGHCDLDRFGFPNNHWDPGPGFPWDVFLDDVRRYVRLGAAPEPTKVPVPANGRPASAPRLIPAWAWALMKWHDAGKPEGKRPAAAPAKVPAWYWEWRAWRLGLRAKH